LTLEIYPAAEASTILYEDDGLSFNYLKNEFCLRNINLKTKSDGYEISISNPEGSYRPLNRSIIIQLHDVKTKPSFVKLDKVILSEGDRNWIYNVKTKILKIQFEDKFQEQIVDIEK
jgi:hypothetical protein